MCDLITNGKDYTEVLAVLNPMKARVMNRAVLKDKAKVKLYKS